MIDTTIILEYPEPTYVEIEKEATLVQVDESTEDGTIELTPEIQSIVVEGVPTVDLVEVGAYVFNSTGGGGGAVSLSREEFVAATTGQALYPLAGTPGAGQKIVFINGITQPTSGYTVAGQNLTFTPGTGITSGDRVGIYYT